MTQEPIQEPVYAPVPTPTEQAPEIIEIDEADEIEVPEAIDEPVETPVPAKKKRHRGIFWGLGILLAVSLAVVLLLWALSFEAHWENGRLVVTFFGADSDYVSDAISGEEQQPQDEIKPIAKAPTGTGVTLPLSSEPAEDLTLQAIYQMVSPSAVSLEVRINDKPAGTGSGIIMTADGYILTNHHVIENANGVTVITGDDTRYEAALVGSDELSDIAVLKVEAEGLPAATFASSADALVGDKVVAIGDPLGIELRGTMTDGILCAINRDVVVGDRTMTLLQTNAALNSGNSGGPLVDLKGRVIGINTMKISSNYVSVEGLGFAIPMDAAKPLVDELIEKGYVSGRPMLGITGKGVEAEKSAFYNIPAGVYIESVQPNSNAATQGLQKGDIITHIEGREVRSVEELNIVKNDFRAGDTVHLTIWRNGETLEIGVLLIDKAQ